MDTFCFTVNHGISLGSWNIYPIGQSFGIVPSWYLITPSTFLSRPDNKFNKVVFPQPEGPTKQQN